MNEPKKFPTDIPFLKTASRGGQFVLLIREATHTGYAACLPSGVFDAAYPTSPYRRARVKEQGRVAGTVMAGETDLCVFIVYDL